MKKYLILLFLIIHLSASYNETSIQVLLAQFKTSLTQFLTTLKKLTKPSGSLLDSIKKGVNLRKAPQFEEKPRSDKKGGLQELLGESELIKKAKEPFQSGLKQEEIQGVSEQEWEESEKEIPTQKPAYATSKPPIPEKPRVIIKSKAPTPEKPASSVEKKPIVKTSKQPKASPEIAAIDFKNLSDQALIDKVEKYKLVINQFSLKQLLDIAADKDTFDSLDPDIVDDLKDAARALKDEAEPAQRAALKFRYGIV
ncbi:MAG: hypothetical protein K2X90_04380 [Candidatus Babeliaceae bacterium]|nr:hypothetical protein [Candidatus Babeliaceae bacterium]